MREAIEKALHDGHAEAGYEVEAVLDVATVYYDDDIAAVSTRPSSEQPAVTIGPSIRLRRCSIILADAGYSVEVVPRADGAALRVTAGA
jgi:hypothetical protein